MKITIFIVLLSTTFFVFGQNGTKNILWNKVDNLPIAYASIKSAVNYTISNEDGVFEFDKTADEIKIQNVAFQTLEIDYDFLTKNDTVFMSPNVYELDEVVIEKDARFNDMLRTIMSDYALEPHQEKFFLRAVIRKNNSLYKIVDFSGYLEKKALFDTSKKPMPKNNYSVQIDNIRKVGLENRSVDFELFNFEQFLNRISSIYLSPKIYNLSYQTLSTNELSKIILTPKSSSETFTHGYYILNNDNTFNEVDIVYNNENSSFNHIKDTRFRTVFLTLKSNFERNSHTDKLQLNKSILKGKVEVYSKDDKDIFDFSYIYYSDPVINSTKLKNNINLKKDMFDLQLKYDSGYWENQDQLMLTSEMQDFINKVNSSGKKSDFRTKTNMK